MNEHGNILKIHSVILGGISMEKEKVGLGRKIVLAFGWTVLLAGIGFFAYALFVNHLA